MSQKITALRIEIAALRKAKAPSEQIDRAQMELFGYLFLVGE